MAKILLIDDDSGILTIVSDKLKAEKHDVDKAMNGAQANERLSGAQYDLLIVDWDLPDTTGVQIIKSIREKGSTVPILMLTGHVEEDDMDTGFEAGADDYITKPFSVRDLSNRVKALLRRGQFTPEQKQGERQPAQTGTMLSGKYRLEEFIGQGGMAHVWKARHVAMDKQVVIKLVQAQLLDDEITVKRFQHECVVMARVNHGNVVGAFDNGLFNDEQPFLVMEYIEGESLADLIRREGPLPVELAIDIMLQICRGLEAAHVAQIIHRDLKPGNILLQERSTDPNWVKIVDFGLALLTSSGQRFTQQDILMGTAGYIPPEQLNGLPPDQRTDVYALGVILFEMLTKELPFSAENTEAFLVKQLLAPAARLSSRRQDIEADSPLDSIARKAMESDPDERYQSVYEMRRELEKLLAKQE